MAVITQEKSADPRRYVLTVSFTKVGKLYQFDFSDYPDLQIGDRVIVNTSTLGQQMGIIKGFVPRSEVREKIQRIYRPATPADLLTSQQWKDREVAALIDCRSKAAEIGGYEAARFIAAEYNFNGTFLTIFYTCDENIKINMQPLRSALQKQFEARLEFRQIGPRDVAKLQNGFGACGIPRCCSTFLTEFSMVSITMAKAQGVSLNPTEITGMCGRLRCCLTYEYKQYVEARRLLPRIRKRVRTPYGEGRVVEVHPLIDAVTVQVNEETHIVPREELIPLDEWEALKGAAASPCSKSAAGGCDCGAKRPRGTPEELLEEMGVPAELEAEGADEGALTEGEVLAAAAPTATPPEQEQGKRRRRRRNYRRRRRGKEGGKPDSNA